MSDNKSSVYRSGCARVRVPLWDCESQHTDLEV